MLCCPALTPIENAGSAASFTPAIIRASPLVAASRLTVRSLMAVCAAPINLPAHRSANSLSLSTLSMFVLLPERGTERGRLWTADKISSAISSTISTSSRAVSSSSSQKMNCLPLFSYTMTSSSFPAATRATICRPPPLFVTSKRTRSVCRVRFAIIQIPLSHHGLLRRLRRNASETSRPGPFCGASV